MAEDPKARVTSQSDSASIATELASRRTGMSFQIEECHADNALDLPVQRGSVVSQHAAGAEAVQHDRAIVACQFGVDQIAGGAYPVAVNHPLAFRDFSHAVFGHVDSDRLVARRASGAPRTIDI